MQLLKAHSRITMRTLSALGIFVCGFAVGWATFQLNAPHIGLTESGVRVKGEYKLIAPLLLCSSTQTGNIEPYLDLEKKIDSLISTTKKTGNVSDVSVYFRDFKGNWLDVNGTEQYAPASLLKVPIMIAYFKESETNPSILNTRLTYNGLNNENDAEDFATSSDLTPGTYTVNELIRAMIVSSDNNAATLLYNYMNKDWLAEVYSDLGLTLTPGGSANTQDITAKQYSYFFRILYNATYLTPADSEKALTLLTGPDFPQGIESTVPANVLVANKFGERTILTQAGVVLQRELHDCGIIYSAKGPYLICIMTRGKDFPSLIGVIDSVSSTVYQALTK